MGSVEYFFSKLGKEINLKLSPVELKYIATCIHSYKSSITKKIEEAAKENKTLEIKAYELKPYPTLLKKIILGQRNVLNYFESMEREGHNRTLLEQLKSIAKSNPELKGKKAFQNLIEHVYDCTVWLGKNENGNYIVWSPDGKKEVEIDTTYSGILPNGKYFTTHGKNEKGARFGVRVIKNKKTISGLKMLEKLWNDIREECGI